MSTTSLTWVKKTVIKIGWKVTFKLKKKLKIFFGNKKSMNPKMDDMIREAKKLQEEELAWVSNLYQQRLRDLQETEVRRQEWLQSQEGEE